MTATLSALPQDKLVWNNKKTDLKAHMLLSGTDQPGSSRHGNSTAAGLIALHLP